MRLAMPRRLLIALCNCLVWMGYFVGEDVYAAGQ